MKSDRKKILLIEDEPGMVLTIGDRLRGEGYEISVKEDGLSGYEEALSGQYDLILLDIMLPGKDGLNICRDLRGQEVKTPIIMITAKSQVIDRVLGLKIGADDYLTKPFDFMELSARIEALIRRSVSNSTQSAASSAQFTFGPFTLNTVEKRLFRGTSQVELSHQEYKLLDFFLSYRNHALSREEILDGVWGFNETPTTRTVDVHVAWLRQKLKNGSDEYIQTVHKHGYRFVG